ncbi:hypothetical protein JCM10213_007420 [Rhodosporidiobolus nylandii]
MVKVASSLLVGAALVAPVLAAPTRMVARAGADVATVNADLDSPATSDDIETANVEAGLLSTKDSTESLEKREPKVTSTDKIRRGAPLSPGSAEGLAKRGDLVTGLGLDGTLAPLGLGDLVPTLTGAINGLPVVGAPVGGLVKTVDNTVGVTALLQPKKAAAPAAAPAKRDLLSSLTGTLGGATGSLPVVGGATNGLLGGSTSSALGGNPLSGLLGNPQLSSLLGQLQALGLGNLPLSQLGQLNSAVSGGRAAVADTTASTGANSAIPGNLMSQLSVAQAEQLGLLAPGTAQSLLATVQATAENPTGNSMLAKAFKASPHAFKATGSNETETATPSSTSASASSTPSSTASAASSDPTFSIASPEAVASAMAKSSGSSFAANPDADGQDDAMDSGSEYSDDDGSVYEEDDDADHAVGSEGQGPNASGAGSVWQTASSTDAAQASATAEAMSLSYSDASATAVPTSTGNAKRWAFSLD